MDDVNAVGGSAVGGRELTVPEAARVLGISERAVRWRIQAGTIGATKRGKSWAVHVPVHHDAVVERGSDSGNAVEQRGNAVVDAVVAEPEHGSAAAVALVRQLEERNVHVRDLERINMELAGQVGYLQAELAQAREQLRLSAPVDTTVDDGHSDPGTPARSWWRRLLG